MADPEVRAFAGWELDYRIAFAKTSLPQKETAPIDRSRWTMAGAALVGGESVRPSR